ncbi:tail fiber assembly protein [Kosakonia sp. MUSA4]|uniref:tail fiber assembly protein n=1 Tax=Kosakonia sp. MUSA4 TaxID=2067958 RepID=UPI00159B0F82|nr:hypothetical protein C0557_09530 [Kosakonia sp. MUSA4]
MLHASNSLTGNAVHQLIQRKLQAGRAQTEAEATKLNAVLDSIDAVNTVDMSNAPGIIWLLAE